MDSRLQINVPLRSGGKKMRKRRELDALIAHSIAKRGQAKNHNATNGSNSQDKLLSASTDDQEEYVWPTIIRNSNRCRKKRFTFLRMCGPLLFLCFSILIVLMFWLYFDLRQQLYDYRQKVEEVSAASQNLPDTLQKWHETSTYLVKNQTVVYAKINNLYKNLENLRVNFTAYKETLKSKQDFAEDQKMVANFGARIEAVATDLEEIKDHFSTVVNNQKNIKYELERIQSNFTAMVSIASATGNIPSNYTGEVESLKLALYNNMKIAAMNLSIVNDTLSQKSSILKEELQSHKAKIDELLDRSANMTSHVTSIEDSWTKYRQKILDLDIFTRRINNNVWEINNKTVALEQSVQNISNTCIACCNEYKNSNKLQKQSIPNTLDYKVISDGITSSAIGNWSLTPNPGDMDKNSDEEKKVIKT